MAGHEMEPLFGDVEEPEGEELDDASIAAAKAIEDAKVVEILDKDGVVAVVKDADADGTDDVKDVKNVEADDGDDDTDDDVSSHPLVKELMEQNEAVMAQQQALQLQIAELTSKQPKVSVGDNIDAQLAKLDQDDSVSVGALRAVLTDLKAEREQTSEKNAILSAQVQELHLKANPKYADYNEVVGDSARVAMQDPRTRDMILASQNPPLALYTLCKAQHKKAKSKSSDDSTKEILRKVRDARKTGRGAGQGSQGSRPKTPKGGKRSYEDLLKLPPAELLKVSDEELYDAEQEAAQG